MVDRLASEISRWLSVDEGVTGWRQPRLQKPEAACRAQEVQREGLKHPRFPSTPLHHLRSQ